MSDYDPPILGDDSAPAPAPAPDPDTAVDQAAETSAPVAQSKATDGQWDIVKRQFGKNRAAVWGLRITVLLVFLAIYAPLIASGQPFLYSEGGDASMTFPWFTTLLDASVWEHMLDRLFNITMVTMAVFLLGRLAFRVLGHRGATPGKRRWRKAMIAITVVVVIAHGVFDVGMSKSAAKEYRASIDAVKEAEDLVAAAPIGERFQAALPGMRRDFGALSKAVDVTEAELQALKSRAASRVLRPLSDLDQSLQAVAGDIDLTLQRMARVAGLTASELEALEGGSDSTLNETLRTAWYGPAEESSSAEELDPATELRVKIDRLALVPGPMAEGLRARLLQLSDQVRDDLSDAAAQYDRTVKRLELPSSEQAAEQLAKARAAREAQTMLFAPVPYGYREMLPQGYDSLRKAFDGARGERHLFGTDQTGRDVFARILFGTRISLTIGLFAVSIYVTIGTILGALAGYFRGWVDMLIMRSVEILICIPGLFLILTIVALFDQKSIWLIMFAISIVSWTGITRLVRGEFLRERNSEYVLAAQAMGYSTPRIIFRHVLPNSVGPILVSATFGIAGAIMTESGLSFLGLGDVSVPSWGGVLNDGRNDGQWHMIIPPSVAIFITVTALNLVGDGVRDALDPKLRN